MSEKSERKGWQAHAAAAAAFYRSHGGEAMSATDRVEYERLLRSTQDAVRRHNEARGAGSDT